MLLGMLKDKRGQWGRAMARERRSQERRERLGITKEMLKQGLSADDIAYKLGVSGLTVRQYIREVGHLADIEQNVDMLQGRLQSVEEQIKKLSGTNNPHNFQKLIKLKANKHKLLKQININGEGIYEKLDSKVILNSIEEMYASIYSSIILSVWHTFLDERNKGYSGEERDEFRKYFSKWKRATERGLILKGNYEEFLEEADNLTKKDILIKLPLLIKKVEKKVHLTKLLLQANAEKKRALSDFGLESTSTRNLGVFVYDFRKLFLNAKVPALIFGMLMMVGSLPFGFVFAATGISGFIYETYLNRKIRLKNKL
ncbi:hypothetical protein HYX13_04345, partial [Candidatus Woesearchaeota archaeon]|nr:hypothetical protein [Candidatus Woesearchaeota archaeon]